LSFSALQHLKIKRPFSSLLSKRPAGFCPAYRKSRTQGLATLSTALALSIRGSLFQLPTLLGFALQSFLPLGKPVESFESTFPLLRFSIRPFSLMPALQRLSSPHEAVLLFAARRFSSGRSLLLSWAFWSLGFSHLTTDEGSLFLSPFPSRPSSPSFLAERGSWDPRGFRSCRFGISRYRVPTRLTF